MTRSIIAMLLPAAVMALAGSPHPTVSPPGEAAATQPPATTRPTTRPAKVSITIGRDTTYITGPLNADGTVNYVAYINAEYSKGVTPQNNAAVLLARAIGPKFCRKEVRAKAFKAIGMAVPPAKGDYFVPLGHYVEGLPKEDQPTLTKTAEQKAADKRRGELGAKLMAGKLSKAEFEEFDTLLPPRDITNVASDQLDEAMRGPWSAKQYLIIAGWLKVNAKPLALMTGATKRSRFYLPLISRSDPPRIVDALGPSLTGSLRAAKALTARATLKIKTGERPGAWADLMAARRLGRLVSQAPTLIDHLVGIGIERAGCQGCMAFIVYGRLPAPLARASLADLNALGAMPDIRRSIANERFMALDATMMFARGPGEGLVELAGGPSGALGGRVADAIARRVLDWDEMLRIFNHWHDRMGKVMAVRDVRKRRQGFERIGRDLQEMAAQARSQVSGLGLAKSIAKSVLGFRSKQLTKALAGILVSMLMPALGKIVDVCDERLMQAEVLHAGAALALHEAETGRFPATLGELTPKYLKVIPPDRFSGKGLVYRREGKGCVVYSVGMNLKDDGGIDHRDDGEIEPKDRKDDIVIRFKR